MKINLDTLFLEEHLSNNHILNNNVDLLGAGSKIIFYDSTEQVTAFSNSLKTTYDDYGSDINTNSSNIVTLSQTISNNLALITTNTNVIQMITLGYFI